MAKFGALEAMKQTNKQLESLTAMKEAAKEQGFELSPAPEPKPKRPAAKSSNPDYETVNVLIHRETKYRMGAILSRLRYEKKGNQDISELVDELLRNWIAENS